MPVCSCYVSSQFAWFTQTEDPWTQVWTFFYLFSVQFGPFKILQPVRLLTFATEFVFFFSPVFEIVLAYTNNTHEQVKKNDKPKTMRPNVCSWSCFGSSKARWWCFAKIQFWARFSQIRQIIRQIIPGENIFGVFEYSVYWISGVFFFFITRFFMLLRSFACRPSNPPPHLHFSCYDGLFIPFTFCWSYTWRRKMVCLSCVHKRN